MRNLFLILILCFTFLRLCPVFASTSFSADIEYFDRGAMSFVEVWPEKPAPEGKIWVTGYNRDFDLISVKRLYAKLSKAQVPVELKDKRAILWNEESEKWTRGYISHFLEQDYLLYDSQLAGERIFPVTLREMVKSSEVYVETVDQDFVKKKKLCLAQNFIVDGWEYKSGEKFKVERVYKKFDQSGHKVISVYSKNFLGLKAHALMPPEILQSCSN